MIIGGSKKEVITNIQAAAQAGDWHRKVEVDDPEIPEEELERLLARFWKAQGGAAWKVRNGAARAMVKKVAKDILPTIRVCAPENWQSLARTVGGKLSEATPVKSVENSGKVVEGRSAGVIITCNHFNPLDSLNAMKVAREVLQKKLYIVIQDTNLALAGQVGFLMNNLDNLPISKSPQYMLKTFMPKLRQVLDGGGAVLIYPEEEMWFNYRKPRPCRRGAYQFAHLLGVPVVSLFVEMQEVSASAEGLPTASGGADAEQFAVDNDGFYKVDWTVHILPMLAPDANLSARADAKRLAELDYQQRVAKYEGVYGRKLDYNFASWDIAGWRG